MERPKLRPVEPLPVEVEGRTLVALNDPDRYCDETALLDPVNTVQEVHAVVLSGGSAFGLDAASGVTSSTWPSASSLGASTSC